MAEYLMIMKGSAGASADWTRYIKTLVASGKFRGGSALANGVCVVKGDDGERPCGVTGYMRFEAHNIDEVRALLDGNPVFEAGDAVEILEAVVE